MEKSSEKKKRKRKKNHEIFGSYILNKYVMVVIDGEVINLGAFIGDLVKCKTNRQDIFQSQ